MIEIQSLRKDFGALQVLKDITLHVNDGEIYGLIGQSGAGKSTLLRCINGLESYQAGSVLVDGQEVNTLGAKELHAMQKRMGMIFQNFNLLARETVFGNVALPMHFSGMNPREAKNKKRILELIDLVGLSDKVNARPRELSGGQKQRVAIARALVLNPRILLCDEATSALDPQITQGILSLLLQIRREMNLTMVVVTHQMEVVKRVCERVAFLKDGVLLAEGRPEDLFVKPNRDIRKFLGDESGTALPASGRNLQLFFMDSADENPVITRAARELGVDFSICRANLENFHDAVLGSLIINVKEKDCERICQFVRAQGVRIEEVQ